MINLEIYSLKIIAKVVLNITLLPSCYYNEILISNVELILLQHVTSFHENDLIFILYILKAWG